MLCCISTSTGHEHTTVKLRQPQPGVRPSKQTLCFVLRSLSCGRVRSVPRNEKHDRDGLVWIGCSTRRRPTASFISVQSIIGEATGRSKAATARKERSTGWAELCTPGLALCPAAKTASFQASAMRARDHASNLIINRPYCMPYHGGKGVPIRYNRGCRGLVWGGRGGFRENLQTKNVATECFYGHVLRHTNL